MPDLYKRVQDGASRFTAPPILMATKVKLLPGEKKWATALDSVLARALGAFLVNASSDSQLLFRLAAEAGVPKGALQVTVKKFTGVVRPPRNCALAWCALHADGSCQRHTVPAPPAGFKTMLSLLQISDDNCANALIDSNRCEQLVVVEDIAEVQRKFWLGSQRARETPRGLISAVDVKGVLLLAPRIDLWLVLAARRQLLGARRVRGARGNARGAGGIRAARRGGRAALGHGEPRRD
jgi:hypothetical protein